MENGKMKIANTKMMMAGGINDIYAQREAAWRRALAEMPRWARAYGSIRLSTAVQHGYRPIGPYVLERLAAEWPGWRLYQHIASDAAAYPTQAALDIEEKVMVRMERVDWPMTLETRITRDNREIIVVEGYLGLETIFYPVPD